MKPDAQNILGKISFALAVGPVLIFLFVFVGAFFGFPAEAHGYFNFWILVRLCIWILLPLALVISIAGLIRDERKGYALAGFLLGTFPIVPILATVIYFVVAGTDH